MKLATFTYTKADGSISEREVMVVVKPSEYLEGIDVSELDSAEFQDYLAEVQELEKAHTEAMKKLAEKHDIKYNYRKFKASGITNLQYS